MHKLFQLVPEIQKRDFIRFLDSSREKKVQIGDYCWNYRLFDDYGKWILILPGFRFTASLFYQYALRLAQRFRVLVLDFPEVAKIGDILSAIDFITDKEKITEYSIIGFGDFGFIGPLLGADSKCKNIVIGNVLCNTETMSQQLRQNLISNYEKHMKALKHSSRKAVARRVRKEWGGIPARVIGEELFWQIYFRAQADSCTKESEGAYFNLVLEFLQNYRLDPERNNTKKCLFIDIINDADTIRKDLSLALRDFYTELQVIEERNSDNAALLSRKTSIINKIEDFLKDSTSNELE
ncbi:MAG: hypothetical protein JW874_12020 [Spirochaetales bacterium]|nr:hypothetical protein [Spirochaetales bacterium]